MTLDLVQGQAFGFSLSGINSDREDYLGGNFAVSGFGAVPEPAAWAMMIGGFGAVGATMRRRQRVAVSYA